VTPESLFAALFESAPSKPFVTFYDEASGERAELSAKSLANWVAKTHHLLTDELGLGVGDAALVALPAHWISVPVLLGCLSAGLSLSDTAGTVSTVAFVTDQTRPRAAGIPDVYAISTESAAVGFRGGDPDGTTDYVLAVRPHDDVWAGVHSPAAPGDDCLPGATRAEVVRAAAQRAKELGLAAGGRLLSTRDWAGPQDWVDAVLAPLAVGGSLVLVRNCPSAELLARRVEQERATAVLTEPGQPDPQG
jgi:uncharacterized protein (TIGR03089 family)